jgi:hypothetical protein
MMAKLKEALAILVCVLLFAGIITQNPHQQNFLQHFFPFQNGHVYGPVSSGMWDTLQTVRFAKEAEGYTWDFPKPLQALDGTPIEINGYIYPLEQGPEHQHFVLTSLPLNACYFCGVGTPATLIEVFAKEKISFQEAPIVLRGTLELNHDQQENLFFKLQQAEWIR